MAFPGFTRGNRYLFSPDVWTWNLPSGYTCPGASECLAYADRATGRVTQGAKATFKCYYTVTERFPAVREKGWANRELVWDKPSDLQADLIWALIPRRASLIRIHAGGDFFNQSYFDAWLDVCRRRPDIHFWAFTKSLPFWLRRHDAIPSNLVLTASYGGKHDHLIDTYGLKSSRVVYSEAEAERLGLPIDTDDRLAAYGTGSFALLENFTRSKSIRLPVAG